MMDEKSVRAFFAAYESRFNTSLHSHIDVEATMQAFANCFVEASPVGITCGKNDEQFRQAIPKGIEFYRSIGTTAMKILAMDITMLDDFHAMAEVYWEAFYNTKEGNEDVIEFTVIYLVQGMNDQIKIFAYITGDEQKVLQERGLI
jgi:hypothetical protein